MELLEREPFLQALQEGYHRCLSGEGHVFFIMGEAGIGKSSLVTAFLQEVRHRSRVFVALCDSLFTPRPLGPIYDLALQVNPSTAEAMATMPSRTGLFAQLVQEFTRHNKPTLFVIEDIHWADQASVDFIKFFARRIASTHCLLLLTYRDAEVAPDHPLRSLAGELSSATFTRLPLPLLSPSAVAQLAQKSGYKGEDLYNITGGNPFYIAEMTASYRSGIPDNIRDAVLALYNRQEEATKNLWQLFSIMPEGLESGWMGQIDADWHRAVENCFTHGILLFRNDRIVFKHELFRRTIESSLSPFRRLELNRKILELFLPTWEKEGAVERIVHYAKNAGENGMVARYAPLAAQKAADLASHIEAARLYQAAIDYNAGKEDAQRTELYERYAYECYLTHQISEAIVYQGKVLKSWQGRGDAAQAANSMRFLSRLWWFEGQRKEAEAYAVQSIEAFENLPDSKPKALAYSNLSQLKMLSDEREAAVYWGNKAIAIGNALNDPEILSHALNNVGTAQYLHPGLKDESRKMVEESLRLALQHDLQEHVARAYCNLLARGVTTRDYKVAKRYLDESLVYCSERDLFSWLRYLLGWKAKMLLDTGDWPEAQRVAEELLSYPGLVVIVKINALLVLGTVRLRRGDEAAIGCLQEANQLAMVTNEHQRIMPVLIGCLEAEWLTGRPLLTEAELEKALAVMQATEHVYINGEASYWFQKAKPTDPRTPELYRNYQQLQAMVQAGKGGVDWQNTPYEEALSLCEGREEEQKRGLLLLQQLGATAVAEKMKSRMRAGGIKKIPRGMRSSTLANPAQLTLRELDILQLLKTGAQNKEIAAKLFISPKTVDHHISSILFKLDVPSRTRAVGEAERLGILK